MEFLHIRAYQGASQCCYCLTNCEDTTHLFLQCNIIIGIWARVITVLGCRHLWQGGTLIDAWTNWWQHYVYCPRMRNLPLIMAWEIWIGRNMLIFNGIPIDCDRICAASIATYQLLPLDRIHIPPTLETPEIIDHSHAWAYFDGASNA